MKKLHEKVKLQNNMENDKFYVTKRIYSYLNIFLSRYKKRSESTHNKSLRMCKSKEKTLNIYFTSLFKSFEGHLLYL